MPHNIYEVVSLVLDGMVGNRQESSKKYEWNSLVAQVDVLSNWVMEMEAQAM